MRPPGNDSGRGEPAARGSERRGDADILLAADAERKSVWLAIALAALAGIEVYELREGGFIAIHAGRVRRVADLDGVLDLVRRARVGAAR